MLDARRVRFVASPSRLRYAASVLAIGLAAWSAGPRVEAQERIESAEPARRALIQALEPRVAELVDRHRIPALSIALVDGTEINWAKGFAPSGAVEPGRVTAATLYRVGSVSKLINAMLVQRLAEEGRLDLDRPIRSLVPEFQPLGGDTITARQLLGHRSGLVREPPEGSYFDRDPPIGLAEVVESLGRTPLVDLPGARTKYSNLGPSVVGLAIERVRNRPFADLARDEIFGPLGMNSTDFELSPRLRAGLAPAEMWTLDGRRFAAPVFQLGTGPAGNLVSNVLDLGRLLTWLMDPAPKTDPPVLSREALARMWTPGVDKDGQPEKYGLGFAVSSWRGHKRVGHGGAVYGFSTEVAALPEQRVGVVVCAALDGAWGITRQLADESLAGLLSLRSGEALPKLPAVTKPIRPGEAIRLAGRYGEPPRGFELWEQEGRLYGWPQGGGIPAVIRSQGNAFEFDGPLASGTRLSFENGSLLADNVRHPRQTETAPSECPDEWSGLIGEYGEDHNILYILEHRGQLCALIEWFFLYPLEPRGGDRFAFAGEGLYVSEEIVFERDNDGRGKRAIAAGIRFDRKPIGLGGDEPFRIKPLRPIDELRREIANAEKPAEPGQFRAPDLVELASLDPTLRFDIRYATERNFLGAPLYPVPRAYLQRPAAEALARAHRALANHGFGLWIHDAYRPWKITKLFWEATPVPLRGFVADPARGSRHNRGCAVDLTLYDLKSGQPVIMPSGYDEFTDRARPYYPGGTTAERWRRDLLRRTMEAEGFTVFEGEWWHFDFKDWASYPILDLPLESVPGG